MSFQIAIVIIDLGKEGLAVVLDADEIVLAPRIVVVIERSEGLDLLERPPFAPRFSSAATPAVIMTRPPRNVVRKASFRARIFARLAPPSSLSFHLTHC